MSDKPDFNSIIKRRDHFRHWLKSYHPLVFVEQKHCDEGTSERAYWHHGYMMAIIDILVFLGIESREDGTTSKAIH